MPYVTSVTSLGPLTLFEEDEHIISLDWGWPPEQITLPSTPLLKAAQEELEAYFAKKLQRFTVPVAPMGTAFQKRVWDALLDIPFGETRSYGRLAEHLKTGPRALGHACGRNPIPILIPCHRVLTAAGGLGGYSGLEGIDSKRTLLALEGGLPGN